MICPKCGHEQGEAVECESCGIIFEKYHQAQLRQEQQQREREDAEFEKRNRQTPVAIPLLVLVVVIVAVAGYFMLGDDDEVVAVTVENTGPAVVDKKETANSISANLEKSHKPRNKIEAARNATVFIETGWSSIGSGFIVSSDCWVVTNRHVLDFDVEERTRAGISSNEYKQAMMIELSKEQVLLTQMKQKYHIMQKIYGDTDESRQLQQEIEEKTAYIASLPDTVEEEVADKLERIKRDSELDGYTVSLVDDTSFTIHDVKYSDSYDLAMFKLPADGCPYLTPNLDTNLAQGSHLYTIGNPSGLGYSVTAGIFSGYAEIDGRKVVQTDAPINPGNSGGPLIVSDGQVVGINTSILAETQGIGFAIPVEAIMQEFGDYLSDWP